MTSHDDPLPTAVLDLFEDGDPRTLRTVMEGVNAEGVALSGLDRLEGMDHLVRVRAGTGTPVWRPHAEADSPTAFH